VAGSRGEQFGELVLDAVERLGRRWADELRDVRVLVEEVPDAGALAGAHDGLALGRHEPAAGSAPARVVLYRRPIEARALDPLDLAELVHDVVVEQVADLLGRPPEEIDPGYAEG
jgi:predicted Zn-dependent protease with MMP-like domain